MRSSWISLLAISAAFAVDIASAQVQVGSTIVRDSGDDKPSLSVALSSDRQRPAIGVPNTAVGASYLVLSQDAYLKASNTGTGDSFGYSVAASGDTLVIGAYLEDSNSRGIDGAGDNDLSADSGAVYVFVRTGADSWSQQAYIKAPNADSDDRFGQFVAIDGDTLVVGAIYEDSAASGVDGDASSNALANSGAVYVYVRDEFDIWSLQAYLKASNPDAEDLFGRAVAISGDTVVVGASNEDSPDNSKAEAGAAYVFCRDQEDNWTQQSYLYLNAGSAGGSADAGDRFGASVAISGTTIVVGAPGADGPVSNSSPDQGTAYVFRRSSTIEPDCQESWLEKYGLFASNGEPYDEFGNAVAISGNTVVVGALGEDGPNGGVNGGEENGLEAAGAAYVFELGASSRTQQAYLKASSPDSGDYFGWAVSIEGDTVIVGAYLEDSAATGLDGDDTDNSESGAGAAYAYARDASGAWSQTVYLKASNTDAEDRFGSSLVVSDGYALIGAYTEDSSVTGVNGDDSDNSASAAGAAYLFRLLPDQPNGLAATDGAYVTKVRVTWSDVDGESYYILNRCIIWPPPLYSYPPPPEGICEDIATLDADTTQFDDFIGTNSNPHYYRLRACNDAGCSVWSDHEVGFQLRSNITVTASDGSYPDKVLVSWTNVESEDHYEILRCEENDSTNCQAPILIPPDTSSYDYTDLPAGVTYSFRVKVCSVNECSSGRSDLGFRGPSDVPPSNITASDGDYFDKVLITWNDVAGEEYYEIYRDGSLIASPPANATSFDDTGAAVDGSVHQYRMKACNSAGCSEQSSAESGYRAPPIPAVPTSFFASDGGYPNGVRVGLQGTIDHATFMKGFRCAGTGTASCTLFASSEGTGTPWELIDEAGAPETLYYYRVKACNQSGCSGLSDYDTGYYQKPLPQSPTGVSASDGTYTEKIRVTWQDATDEDSYRIYRCSSPSPESCGSHVDDMSQDSVVYDDTAASSGGDLHYYRVDSCVDSHVGEGFQPFIRCRQNDAYDSGYRRLPPPANVSASDGDYSDKVRVTWSDGGGETSYQVFRCSTPDSGSCGAAIHTTAANVNYYDDTGAASDGTVHYYRLKACNGNGCSDLSAADSGYRIPDPAGLTASDGAYPDKVRITWNDASGESGYQVYRCLDSGTGACSQIAVPSANVTVYDDAGAMDDGTVAYYRLKVCAGGCSNFSSADVGFRLGIPDIVSASQGAFADKVTIIWDDKAGETSYAVFRCDSLDPGTCGTAIASTTENATSYDDLGASPTGATHFYRLKACNGNGCTDFSAGVNGYRRLAAPGGLAATDGTFLDKVRVTWTDGAGETFYEVFRCSSSGTESCDAAIATTAADADNYDDTGADSDGTVHHYRVKACNSNGCSEYSAADSGYRGVESPGCTYTITQPNGGENWVSGETYSITWIKTGGNCAATADLELHEAGSYMQTIALDRPGTTFGWTIPIGQSIGYQYTVKVVDSVNLDYYAESTSTFIINDPYCNTHIMPALTEYGTETYEACDVLIVPPGFGAANGSSVRLSSGRNVVLEPGFSVETGGVFETVVCGQSLCETSPKPMPNSCHTCVELICIYDPTCCGLEWDQACVDRVANDCGLVCE